LLLEKAPLEKNEVEKLLEKIKAMGNGEDAEFGSDPFDSEENRDIFTPLILQQPPFAEHLLQRTLWAEIEKLY
jgi:hypothetical protein